jgi:hypothetical protein
MDGRVFTDILVAMRNMISSGWVRGSVCIMLIAGFAPWLFLWLYYFERFGRFEDMGSLFHLEMCIVLRSLFVGFILIPLSVVNLLLLALARLLVADRFLDWCLWGGVIGAAEALGLRYLYEIPCVHPFRVLSCGVITGGSVAVLLLRVLNHDGMKGGSPFSAVE